MLQVVTGTDSEGDSQAFKWLALERDLVFESGHIWRFVTYAFCHSETRLTHIICNMLALFFLGRIVAQKLGEREFLAVYLVAAGFAGVVQACSMAIYRSPGPDWALGASGAVSAVFVLFAMYYPRLKLYFFGLIPIQARWLLFAVVAYDACGFAGLVPSVFVGDGTRIGHAAHLGGLIFGFLYFQWNMNLTGWWNNAVGRTLEQPSSSSKQFHLRVYNPATQPEVSYAEKVDDILDKIHQHGEASLTDRERRILTQASDHYNTIR